MLWPINRLIDPLQSLSERVVSQFKFKVTRPGHFMFCLLDDWLLVNYSESTVAKFGYFKLTPYSFSSF